METKAKLPVDRDVIKSKMKEMGLTYSDIERVSDGRITEHSLKHFMNKGLKADEDTLKYLADILGCPLSETIDREYRLSENLSFEINKMINNLYIRNKEKILPIYSRKIEEFRTVSDLRAMLNCGHHLHTIINKDDVYFNKNPVTTAFNQITNELVENNYICNMGMTGLTKDLAESLNREFVSYTGDYVPQQALLVFLYAFIIFDAIFLEECVASTAQQIPQRRNDKAIAYCQLTYRSEKMRNTLIERVLYKGTVFKHPVSGLLELDEVVLKGVSLILGACERCYRHIKGAYTDSELVNQVELSAILKTLEEVFHEIGIDLPCYDPVEMANTRFGHQYLKLQTFFNIMNPPRKPKNKYFSGALDVAFALKTGGYLK